MRLETFSTDTGKDSFGHRSLRSAVLLPSAGLFRNVCHSSSVRSRSGTLSKLLTPSPGRGPLGAVT